MSQPYSRSNISYFILSTELSNLNKNDENQVMISLVAWSLSIACIGWRL